MRSRTSDHWRLLAELLRPQRRVLAVLAVGLAASGALPLAGPQLLRAFIDRAVAGASVARLLAIAAAYAVLGLLTQVATVGATYVATRVSWTVLNDLRERAAAHALRLELAYHAATQPGRLIERIDGDATAMSTFFTNFVIKVVSAGVTVAGALLLVAREDWRIGLAMAAFAAMAITVTALLRNRAVPQSTAERAAYSAVIGVVEEQLDGAEDVRALGAGPHALDRHERASGAFLSKVMVAARARVWIWVSTMGSFAAGGMLMLLAGEMLQRRGLVTVGTVFLLFQYTQVLRRPIELIAEQLQELQRAAAGAARMRTLLDTQPAMETSGRALLPAGALSVDFEGVEFCYADVRGEPPSGAGGGDTPGRLVLRDVNLAVSPGQVVGLVGHTGSGKTTLARLSLRLADPTRGVVRVGGVDLRDVDADELRRRVAVVTQDVQLFTASVRDNLTLFDAAPPDAALADLLDGLGLGGWLHALPAGLDTVLGEDTQPSAGQGQLLGLGRAFLRDPGLVLLDEASSRVDPATAALVERALDRLLAGRTAVVIAHRLRAVERADVVVVLEHGRIVETGARSALVADPASRFSALLRADKAGPALAYRETRR
ncbi:MAG: ABC transporter ATP-binding protein [Egibacteraceae bacterium]